MVLGTYSPWIRGKYGSAKKEVLNWETDLGNPLRIPKQDKKINIKEILRHMGDRKIRHNIYVIEVSVMKNRGIKKRQYLNKSGLDSPLTKRHKVSNERAHRVLRK